MNEQDLHIDLFDLYLKGELKGPELSDFEKRLSEDKAFAEAFEVHKILVGGIRDHGRQELKNFLKEHGKMSVEKAPVRKWNMRYAAAASFILIVGAGAAVYYYLQPSQYAPEVAISEIKQEEPAVTDSARVINPEGHTEAFADRYEMRKMTSKEEEINAGIADAPIESFDLAPGIESVPPPAIAEKDMQYYKTDDGLTVLSEKRLKDTLVKAPVLFVLVEVDATGRAAASNEISLSKHKNMNYATKKSPTLPGTYNNNMNNHVSNEIKTLKDTVQIVSKDVERTRKYEDEKKEDPTKKELRIEFWQSPVHFRGYKYTGNSVILYSIPESSAKVYIVNNKTYLRTEGIVYLLETCPNACEFKQETDQTIINFIIQQP